MANVKNLLKKSTNLGANALLLVSTLLPTLSVFSAQTVHATTKHQALAVKRFNRPFTIITIRAHIIGLILVLPMS